MLNPSKSGWIKKYVSLAKTGAISFKSDSNFDVKNIDHVQQKLTSSGIIFGVFGKFIFIEYQEKFNWTPHEKLKVLYFEAMLTIYLNKHGFSSNLDTFIQHLEQFFENCGGRELNRFWNLNKFLKLPRNIESTIHDRTRIPLSLDQNLLVSYLQNSLCYIDVTLYYEFNSDESKSKTADFHALRTKKIHLTLGTIVHALNADDYIEESENRLFQYFLSAADLTSKEREEFELLMHSGNSLQNLRMAKGMNILFRKYLFELAIFSSLSDTDFSSRERKTLNVLSTIFGLSELDINDSYQLVEQFTVDHEEVITKLKSKNSYERIFNRISAKWSKLLLRNKDKLVEEIKESGELVALVKKSMNQSLSEEEKTKVKNQFFDIAKSIPSLTIFMLPGGAFILPFVLKILPDLLPSAFRDNEVEEK